MFIQHQPNYLSYNSHPVFKGTNPNKIIKDAEKVINDITSKTELPIHSPAYNEVSVRLNRSTEHISNHDINPLIEPPKIKGIKKYMTNCHSRDIDPAKIEKLLIKDGATDVTQTDGVKFVTDPYSCPRGKKKKFKLKDGKYVFLEAHDMYLGKNMHVEVRLYSEGARNKRFYLTGQGNFETGYNAMNSHLISDVKGLEWMNK